MRLVRTRIPDVEHEALKARAQKEGRTLQAVNRDALRAHLHPDKVVAGDPLFAIFPLKSGKGTKHRASVEHDRLLYGASP